jgi:pyridoxine 5-phosphate synthase
MAKIGLSLDPIAKLLGFFPKQVPALSKFMSMLELNKISQYTVTYGQDNRGFSAQMIDFINKITDKVVNVYVDYNETRIREVMQLGVDMITLVGGYGKSEFQNPLNITGFEDELKELMMEFSAHDFVTSVCIEPDVESLKKTHKSGFDYVELSALSYASAIDYHEEMNELLRLKEIANMARSLGMGVSVRGDIGEDNITELSNIEAIEEIILEDRFYRDAVFKGFTRTIDDFYSFMKQ